MLTLICGHSRAGKTTYSKRFENVIHLDDTHSTQKVLEKVRMVSGDVVIEGIYYSPKDRIRLIEAYKGQGFRCICLDTSKEVREERHGYKIKHDYPFLIPTLSEGWDEIIIISGDNNVKCINRKTED